jgi:hypothetical protein
MNRVASDLNLEAEIRIERYNKDTVAGQTNYELQGDIHYVYYFYYKHSAWAKQRWTTVNDVIVLKNDPASAIQMDIHYLRHTEKVTITDTDEIDLPDHANSHYKDLVRARMMVEFMGESEEVYNQKLLDKAAMLRQRQTNNNMESIPQSIEWATYSEGTKQYDITPQWVSQDSVATFDSSDVEFI